MQGICPGANDSRWFGALSPVLSLSCVHAMTVTAIRRSRRAVKTCGCLLRRSNVETSLLRFFQSPACLGRRSAILTSGTGTSWRRLRTASNCCCHVNPRATLQNQSSFCIGSKPSECRIGHPPWRFRFGCGIGARKSGSDTRMWIKLVLLLPKGKQGHCRKSSPVRDCSPGERVCGIESTCGANRRLRTRPATFSTRVCWLRRWSCRTRQERVQHRQLADAQGPSRAGSLLEAASLKIC